MVFSENSPVAFLHALKRLCFPSFERLRLEEVLGFGVWFEYGDESLGGVFAFIPLEKQLVAILYIFALGNFCFGESEHTILHLVALLHFLLRQKIILIVSGALSRLIVALSSLRSHEVLAKIDLVL